VVRRLFVFISTALVLGLAVATWRWPGAAWGYLVVGPLVAVGVHDLVQRRHALLRNYPVIGHGRYLLEAIRPEIQQYFVESNIDGKPFDREQRSVIYQRAKGVN
jgi:hypothetical protein